MASCLSECYRARAISPELIRDTKIKGVRRYILVCEAKVQKSKRSFWCFSNPAVVTDLAQHQECDIGGWGEALFLFLASFMSQQARHIVVFFLVKLLLVKGNQNLLRVQANAMRRRAAPCKVKLAGTWYAKLTDTFRAGALPGSNTSHEVDPLHCHSLPLQHAHSWAPSCLHKLETSEAYPAPETALNKASILSPPNYVGNHQRFSSESLSFPDREGLTFPAQSAFSASLRANSVSLPLCSFPSTPLSSPFRNQAP